MSQYPQYPQDNYSNGGNFPVTNPRPPAVTGLAITGIVLGSLGILCRGFNGLMALVMLGNGGKNPMSPTAPPIRNPTFHLVTATGGIIEFAFYLALLIGCIAALNLKPFSRSLLVVWSVGMIVWQLVWVVLEFVVLLPPTLQMMKDIQLQQPKNPIAGQMQGFMQGALIGGYIFWLLFSCVLPILILSMWTRAKVKDAFTSSQNPGQVPPTQFPQY